MGTPEKTLLNFFVDCGNRACDLVSGVRAYIERKRFCRLKEAAITIQRWWRAVLERRCLRSHLAASTIQRVWRSYRARAWVRSLRDNLVQFQAHARGYLLRRDMKNKKRKAIYSGET
ncbi:unconventional myosin-IXb-like [Diaphorina citri]|uniref:Unconventional myosin-IXb-like n=1 Tax=Diaphorina citri TaxID=121845 RepID=A0A3Q0JDM4_DIACI|nr:unconventional myosin-IXb-like [Diaphorina citri]